MGWKNIKTHFNINHHVQVKDGAICIGSSWSRDVIALGLDGSIVRAYEGSPKDSLVLLQAQLALAPELVRTLIEQKDTFNADIPVYTFKDGVIIETVCEVLGWPNVTHDGQMMHDNCFTPSKSKALFWARLDVDSKLESMKCAVTRKTEEIAQLHKDIEHGLSFQQRLDAAHPRGLVEKEPLPLMWLAKALPESSAAINALPEVQ